MDKFGIKKVKCFVIWTKDGGNTTSLGTFVRVSKLQTSRTRAATGKQGEAGPVAGAAHAIPFLAGTMTNHRHGKERLPSTVRDVLKPAAISECECLPRRIWPPHIQVVNSSQDRPSIYIYIYIYIAVTVYSHRTRAQHRPKIQKNDDATCMPGQPSRTFLRAASLAVTCPHR